MKLPWIIAAAAALAATAGAARADDVDLPARKPGLWQMTVTPKPAGAGRQVTAQLCIDAASDRTLMARGLATVSSCTTERSHDAGGNFVFDVACDIMGHKSHSHGVISGDFQSHYTLDVVTTSDSDDPAAPGITGITQESTWIGDCWGDMRPGDMLLPGGRTVNLLTMDE